MKILIVIWSIQIGGAETLAFQLCKYLQDKGHKPYIFPVNGSWDRSYYEYVRTLNVRIISPFKSRIVNWFLWKINAITSRLNIHSFRERVNILYYKLFVRSSKIDLVISHSNVADLFVLKQTSKRIPRIVVEHGEYSYSVIAQKPVSLEALISADKIICVSKWCAGILESVNVQIPTSVIYNGHINTSSITERLRDIDLDKNSFLFGMIGRGIEYKGWEQAIQAYDIVKKENPNCKLILVGDGEFLDTLKLKYKHIPGVVYVGKLTPPTAIVKLIHVGLVPSARHEAFGITILDFFSQGKPVIGTNVGGIPEVINFCNKNGGGVIPTDEDGKADIKALANTMMLFMRDTSVYEKASIDAKDIYTHFTFEKVGRQYETIIKSCLGT